MLKVRGTLCAVFWVGFSISLVYPSLWNATDKDTTIENYIKANWHFCRLQKQSEAVQDSNTTWLHCAEGAAAGGGAGFWLGGGPLGAAAGALAGCVGGAVNETVLRKWGGSQNGDMHTRYHNCMTVQMTKSPIIINGRAVVAPVDKHDIEGLMEKCPDSASDSSGPCETVLARVVEKMRMKR